MKKFSKLLILALALVLIVTAFTVVALASGEESTRSAPYVKTVVGSWEGASVKDGDSIGVGTDGKRPAYIYAEVSPDGNKYEVYTPSPGKTSTGDVWYDTIGGENKATVTKEYIDADGNPATKKVSTYNLADYPYVVYDFDIMTPTGVFGNPTMAGFQFRTYGYYYVDNEYGYNDSLKAGAVRDTGASALDISAASVIKYLDDTPYNWQHVTLVTKAYTVEGQISFDVYVYVNGVLANKTPIKIDALEKFDGKLLEDLAFSYVRQSSVSSSKATAPLVDMTGFVGSEPTTWPDSDPSEWYADKIAFDNPSFSYYQADWDFDAIAAESWARTKDSVPAKGEKSVASIAKADGTIVYYADINAAIAAAEAGEVITVLADLTTTAKVDKAITIDVGMHYTLVETDYLLGTHEFPYYSPNGMYAELDEATGLYTFTQHDDIYYVEWDPACEGDCDCLKGYEHIFSYSSTGVVGEPVVSPVGEAQTDFKVLNGYVVEFLGWSLTKGGEVIDLSTLAPMAGETIKLYPIYEATQYNIEVTTAAGKVTYYKESEFATAVSKVGSKGTVKLLTDVYTECATITFSVSFTLDLNGHALTRTIAYGNVYEATLDGDGKYVCTTDTLLETVANTTNVHFFKAGTSNISFTVTSSVGGGSIASGSIEADTWKYNGEVVKRTATGATRGNCLLTSNEKSGLKLYINGGVTVYMYQLYLQTYASTKNSHLEFTNMNYTFMGADKAPITSSGAYGYSITILSNYANTVKFTDCVINFPYNAKTYNFIMLRTADGKGNSSETEKVNVTFKNCDIIKPANGDSYGWEIAIKCDYDSKKKVYGEYIDIVYDNSRVYDVTYTNFSADRHTTVSAINGTMYRDADKQDSVPNIGDGYEAVAKNFKYDYEVVMDVGFTIDTSGEINKLDYTLVPKSYSMTFTKVVTKPVDVNYVDQYGNVVKKEQLRPGVDSITETPEVIFPLESDSYRNILGQWVDENGKAITEVLGLNGEKVNWQDEYNFNAVEEINGVVKYTGGLKDILFNISFTSNFRYNIYLPEYDKNITINSVSVFDKGATVKVDGYEYAVYSFIAGTATASDDTKFVVNYTYDGVVYEQTLKVNALLYAEAITLISDVEEEKLAVGNMARFIMEARKATGKEVDEELFNEIMEAAGVTDYREEYKGSTNIGILYEYLYSVSYVIYNGNASYKFVLNDASYVDLLNFTLGEKELGIAVVGTQTVGGSEKTYVILDNARVYDIIDTLTITVDGTELCATYSMLDNIQMQPKSNLLKALYEFGLAAENYRAYLQANS